jgi:biotin carboxyl carrier protein
MRTQIFTSHNVKYKVKSMLIGPELWLHINGETYIIDLRPTPTLKAGGSEAAISSGIIKAPMPGKILKVHFKMGEKVEAHKAIIIMEAMKMEYSLSVPFDGRLLELQCQEGQQVELNQNLALIKSLKE